VRRLAATLAVLLAAAGCAGGDGGEGRPEQATTQRETASPPPAGTTETTPSPTPPETEAAQPGPPASAETRPYQVWFHRGDASLELLWEHGPVTKGADAAALRLLLTTRRHLERPRRLESSIPAGTRLLGVDLADETATVDLSAEFGAQAARSALSLRAAQVVYTATQFPTVRRVRLLVEGRPYPVPAAHGASLLRRPLTRRDYETLLPPIVVESPPEGAVVRSPIVVSGTANVFEANVTLRVVDRRGRELASTFTTATCGSGCRGTFRGEVPFRTAVMRAGFVVAQDDDADGDGFPSHAVRVPVRLAP
jgi:spore germination protein GerM